MSKKVSIILPVYNGEDNISAAIDSVLQQTYTNFELIIVNDCSTDGTFAILEDYLNKDERIKVINNPTNQKLPKSLNIGFYHASGDYYTWTSDDNLYKCDAIEKMVNILEKMTGFDMVYSDFIRIDSEGKELGVSELDEPQGLLVGNIIGACFLYTKSVAERVGEYDVNLFLAEDYDYWLRIMREGKIYHLKEKLYYYRQHGGSLTATRQEQIGMQTYRALEKNFLFLATYSTKKKDRYAFYDQVIWRLRNNPEKQAEIKDRIERLDRDYLHFTHKNRLLAKIKRCLKIQ